MDDGEGSLAFSAGKGDHYTLGCASCKMVVSARRISKARPNLMLRRTPEPSHMKTYERSNCRSLRRR
jgi:hypothetical protein